MDEGAIAAMLHEDRAEWEALVAVLEAHPEETLHDPSSPPWTSRNVYIHLARCIENSMVQFEAKLGGPPYLRPEGSEDEITARRQQKYSHLSLDEARAWARQAFERRIQAIEAVPTDRWDEELETIARYDGAEHYAGHRSYIVVA